MVCLLLIQVSLYIPYGTFAQKRVFFKHYTTEDGLPHNIGYGLLEDSKGYLWIGTDDGLAQFDGLEWKSYNTEDGLSSPYPIDITEASDGSIVVGVWKGKINIISQQKIYTLNTSDKVNRINGIGFVNDSLLVAWKFNGFYTFKRSSEGCWKVSNRKILVHNTDSNQIKLIDGKPRSDKDVTIDETDFFITSNKRLFLYDDFPFVLEYLNDSTLKTHFKTQLNGNKAFGYFHKNGHWLGSNGKIFHITAQKTSIYQNNLPNEKIYYLNIVGNRYAYIITAVSRYKARKFYRYDLNTGELVDLRKALGFNTAPSQMMQDRNGNLWVTTNGDGLYCLPFLPFNYFAYEDGLQTSLITALAKDHQGVVWAGTRDGLFRQVGTQFEKYILPRKTQPTQKLYQIDDLAFLNNKLDGWVSLGLRLIHLNPYSNLTDRIERPAGQKLFFPTDTLNLPITISDLGSIFSPYRLNNVMFDSMLVKQFPNGKYQYTSNGKFIIASYTASSQKELLFINQNRDLYHLDNQFNASLIQAQFATEKVNTALFDLEGKLWLGTDQGLFVFNAISNGFELKSVLSVKDGLPSRICRALTQDTNGVFWVGTPKGLAYIYNNETLFINKQSGLLSNDVNCLLLDNEKKLWVGGSKGISVLETSFASKKLLPPKLHINCVQVNNQLLNEPYQLKELPYNSELKVCFQGISLTNAKNLHYQYRLNKGNWIKINDLSLVFSSLQPDSYQLQLRVKEFNSNWTNPLSLSFTIMPPWWFSWWSILGYLLFILGSFWAFTTIRLARQKAKAAEKIQTARRFAELELKALQAQMNPHFIFNALNAIQSFVLDNDARKANKFLARFSQLMRLYLEASKAKYITIHQEVKLLNYYIELEELRFANKFEATIKIDPLLEMNMAKIPGMLIQPFVENAINHGLVFKKQKGRLKVIFTEDNGHLCCLVDDDGIGRAKAMEIQHQMNKKHKSRAMQIIEERLGAINLIKDLEVLIDITDKMDDEGNALGTKVFIKIPIIDSDSV